MTDCRWKITIPKDAFILLSFTEFITEECCDILFIYEDENLDWKKIYELSGSSIPSKIPINANVAQFIFRSDEAINKKGFNISFSTFGKLMK